MRKLVYACCIVVGAALPTGSAEAARCKQGYIYRPSVGVCQTKAAAARQGIRTKRYVKRVIKRPVPRLTYQQHVEQWAKRNRTAIIKKLEGL